MVWRSHQWAPLSAERHGKNGVILRVSLVYPSCISRRIQTKGSRIRLLRKRLGKPAVGTVFFLVVGRVYNYQNVCIYCMFIDKCAVFFEFLQAICCIYEFIVVPLQKISDTE